MVAQPANLGRVHDLGTHEVLKRATLVEDHDDTSTIEGIVVWQRWSSVR